MQPVIYRRRRNAVTRSEREWRVEDDALVTCGASGRERRLAWSDVVAVRLCGAPTRAKPWRHVFELKARNGTRTAIDNGHFVSVGKFEDRSASYAPFVRAALARVQAANPDARALIGETPKRYFMLMLAALIGLGALAFALIVVPSPLDSLPYAGLIKFGLILAMLPVFWRWVIKAFPRGVAIEDIPDRALPPAPADAA